MKPTDKGQMAREKLIRTAAELFVERGYHNTGINNILDQAGMSKGSFYFYFGSKNELAAAVADYFGHILIDEWLAKLPKRNWRTFVDAMTGDLGRFAEEGNYFGCPVIVLGAEIAFSDPELAVLYTGGMKRMMEVYADVLRNSGIPGEMVERLARRAFALSEGHMLYYRISKEIETFQYLRADLLELELAK